MIQTWWPSRYGADDQAGALNEITSEGVAAAARLVRRGAVYDLSHVLAHQLNRRSAAAGVDGLGRNGVNWIVGQVTATSQLGTHIDGLNHLQIGERTYNGHRLEDLVEKHGTNRLGIETLPQVVTRGLLLDVAAARGVDRLEVGDVVTPADAVAALARAGLEVRPGDALLIHTGWGAAWAVDNDRYLSGEPGPGLALAAWLVERRVAITGCDTWSCGPVPSEDPFVVPQTLNVKHGVVVLENLNLARLAGDGVAEFMLVVSHPRVRGATGAWMAPLAIV